MRDKRQIRDSAALDEIRQQLDEAGLLAAQEGRLNEDGEALLWALSVVCDQRKGRKPRYDPVTRELSRGGKRLKTYRRHAHSQESVLLAFEAQGWPERIENPLEEEQGVDRKERLRETVKSLNDGLRGKGIRFRADGMGGVRWMGVRE